METPLQTDKAPRELLIVGGNLALDFANTIDDPSGPAHYDHVGTWTDFLAWSARVTALTPSHATHLDLVVPAAARDTTVRKAQELRKAITRIFGGCAEGAPPQPEHWFALRPFAADALGHAALEERDAGAARLYVPPTDDPNNLWRPIALAAAELLSSPEIGRIKRCAQCPWLFVDHSRNRSRRWCSMDDCGTAVKMERYIARRAAANRRG
jgi:predicted RNA-binding Zn ribbon-like protein